uniref:HNH endonuclease n=1 Tax=Corynebacterium sp. TaxID=1720 RepID=UPI003735CC2C
HARRNHTRFLEFHHLQEFSRGGATDPENLVPLCSACHSLVTHGLATITFDPMNPASLRFSFRDGSVYVSKNRGLPVRDAATESTLDRHKRPCPVGPTLNWDEEPMISFDDDPEENSAAAEKL